MGEMFTKGAAPSGAGLAADTNPPIDLDNTARFTLGATVDRVEADAENYRSYADRMLDGEMQNVLPAATVKWFEQKAAEYNAWEKQQVAQDVAREVEEHCAATETLREGTGEMLDELLRLSGDIKTRSLTTAQALSKLDAIRRQAEVVRRRRDAVAVSTRAAELKLAHPHRYMDTLHQSLKVPRKDVFTR